VSKVILEGPFYSQRFSASDHVQGSGENAGSGLTASETWGKNWSGFYFPLTSDFLTFFPIFFFTNSFLFLPNFIILTRGDL